LKLIINSGRHLIAGDSVDKKENDEKNFTDSDFVFGGCGFVDDQKMQGQSCIEHFDH